MMVTARWMSMRVTLVDERLSCRIGERLDAGHQHAEDNDPPVAEFAHAVDAGDEQRRYGDQHMHGGKVAAAIEAIAEQAADEQHDQWWKFRQRPREAGFIRRPLEHTHQQPGEEKSLQAHARQPEAGAGEKPRICRTRRQTGIVARSHRWAHGQSAGDHTGEGALACRMAIVRSPEDRAHRALPPGQRGVLRRPVRMRNKAKNSLTTFIQTLCAAEAQTLPSHCGAVSV
jgi:hypothetical protein